MLRVLDFRGSLSADASLRGSLPRANVDLSAAIEVVAPLVADVRARGVVALREQAERFDGVVPASFRVAPEAISAAVQSLDPELGGAIREAIRRVRLATAAQVPDERVSALADGATVTQRWVPVRRVGVYVPGGKAVYPSSVVMNVVAAQVAGVEEIALISPAQREFGGGVHPTILAAAGLLGVTEVYALGGAGAIAAVAYGVPEIDLLPVDVVTGPGNIYVAAAKRLVQGVVGIDAVAGTTEIVVIADEQANARFIAADLISQAEHDEAAAAILITASEALATRVAEELAVQVPTTPHVERVRAALGGQQSAILLVDSLADAIKVSDAYGPEHLEIHTANPAEVAQRIRNAGALFLGPYTPVSVGDYIAGSNHVLPTGGSARFSSGLGAYSFLRAQQVVSYSQSALEAVHEPLVTFATAEQLPAHGAAASIRFSATTER